jgi:hypothetical protein
MGNSWPLAHENAPVVARVESQTITAGQTKTSDIIDMRYWEEVVAYFNMGAYAGGNDGSVTVKFQVSNDGSGFSPAVDLTSKALTTGSFTGSALDSAFGVIRVRVDEMSVSGTDYRYLRLSVAPTNQNLTCGATVVGFGCKYGPGSDYDLSAVTEIIP